jgi:hypothetical protein
VLHGRTLLDSGAGVSQQHASPGCILVLPTVHPRIACLGRQRVWQAAVTYRRYDSLFPGHRQAGYAAESALQHSGRLDAKSCATWPGVPCEGGSAGPAPVQLAVRGDVHSDLAV